MSQECVNWTFKSYVRGRGLGLRTTSYSKIIAIVAKGNNYPTSIFSFSWVICTEHQSFRPPSAPSGTHALLLQIEFSNVLLQKDNCTRTYNLLQATRRMWNSVKSLYLNWILKDFSTRVQPTKAFNIHFNFLFCSVYESNKTKASLELHFESFVERVPASALYKLSQEHA